MCWLAVPLIQHINAVPTACILAIPQEDGGMIAPLVAVCPILEGRYRCAGFDGWVVSAFDPFAFLPGFRLSDSGKDILHQRHAFLIASDIDAGPFRIPDLFQPGFIDAPA